MKTHIVTSGETLSGIAKKYLGDASRWKELQGYSGKPESLPIGMMINIPLAGEVSSEVTKDKETSTLTAEQYASNPYLQKPGEEILDYTKRINEMNAGDGDTTPPGDTGDTGDADPVVEQDVDSTETQNQGSDSGQEIISQEDKITELEDVAFEMPEETQEMIDKREELEKAAEDYETALGVIGDNPWLSEAGRVGRNKKLYDMYEMKANRLAGEYNNMTERQQMGLELKQAELNYLSSKHKDEEFLTISEAGTLGLAYGTTRKEAMDQKIVPTEIVKSWADFSDSDKKKLAARGIDWTTEDGWGEAILELYGEDTQGGDEKKILDLLTGFGTRDYVSDDYYNQVRAMSDNISAAEFDRKFGYLKQGGEGGYEFSSSNKGRLAATGLTNSEINQLEKDIGIYGWENLKNEEENKLTEEQRIAIDNVLGGVTPAQERADAEAAERPTDELFKAKAEIAMLEGWKDRIGQSRGKEQEEAIKKILKAISDNNDTLSLDGKVYTLDFAELKKFKDYLKAVDYKRIKELRAEN